MSDIAFSMTADERDVIRGLQNVGKEQGKLREQIAQLVTASKAAGAADSQLAQLRLAALNPILDKQKELKQSFSDIASELKSGKISQEQYNASFKDLTKETNKLQTALNQLSAEVKQDNIDMQRAAQIVNQSQDAHKEYARSIQEIERIKAKGIFQEGEYEAAIAKANETLKEATRDKQAEAAAAAQVARAEAETAKILRDVGAAYGRVSDQIQELSSIAKAAGVSDVQISKTRLAALAPITAKQEEIRREAEQLKTQLAAGSISADEYAASTQRLNQKSTDLATSLNKLQTELKEDASDIRKAGTAMQGAETATDRYKKKVQELDAQKAKGILKSHEYTKAVAAEQAKLDASSQSADGFGGALGPLASKLTSLAAGFVSISAVLATIRKEYDALLERQGKSRDVNLDLAGAQSAALDNLDATMTPEDFAARMRKESKALGMSEKDLTVAASSALSAKGDKTAGDAIDAVVAAAKLNRFAPDQLPAMSGSALDLGKHLNMNPEESLGFLLGTQRTARTVSLKGVSENIAPGIIGGVNMGLKKENAAAVAASLSGTAVDPTGAQTGTTMAALFQQMREFGSAEAGFTGGKTLDAQEVLQQMQVDPEFRKKFLAGKEQGGFGATFEKKMQTSVEQLLTPGTQGFRDYQNALKTQQTMNPQQMFDETVKAKESMPAIQVAMKDQRLANIVDQQRLGNLTGAESASARQRTQEIRDQSGQVGMFSGATAIAEDVMTGGNQTTDQQIKTLQQQLNIRRKAEKMAERNQSGISYGISAVLGGPQATTAESKRETADLEKSLRELIALQREANANNANKAHAGVVGNRRNNQGEAAP